MTREDARKAAEVMLAYADGKKIECCYYKNGRWEETDSPEWDFTEYFYRIKSQPTYRPFKTAEECWNEMLKHQPFGWVKHKGFYITIADVMKSVIIFADNENEGYTFNEAFELCIFADGEPFGVKEDK